MTKDEVITQLRDHLLFTAEAEWVTIECGHEDCTFFESRCQKRTVEAINWLLVELNDE